MPVEIVEILRRSEQGATRPFICRGDDGEVYFVKGKDAGRRSQICEWVAGRLAVLMGLPVAPFQHDRLSSALDAWPTILSEVPDAWWFVDDEQTVPVDFDAHAVEALLRGFENDEFWTWT